MLGERLLVKGCWCAHEIVLLEVCHLLLATVVEGVHRPIAGLPTVTELDDDMLRLPLANASTHRQPASSRTPLSDLHLLLAELSSPVGLERYVSLFLLWIATQAFELRVDLHHFFF